MRTYSSVATIDDQIFKGNKLIPSRSNNLLNLASPFKQETPKFEKEKAVNLLVDTNAYKLSFVKSNQTPAVKKYIKEVIRADHKYIQIKQDYGIEKQSISGVISDPSNSQFLNKIKNTTS